MKIKKRTMIILYMLGIFTILVISMGSVFANPINITFTDSSSDTPYYCYMDSPFHCNSYKLFDNGDKCAKYCDKKVSKKLSAGNRVHKVYNCMITCVYGPNAGKMMLAKRLNGGSGLGLNYKF
jgi:hypothetical protein